MKVLHDWDQSYISGSYAIKKGIKLIIYGICKKLNLKPNYIKDIYEETDRYAIALSQLNEMLGICTIYGIRDHVVADHVITINQLKIKNEVRRHIHIGEQSDPNRQRLWEPPLNQGKHTWRFDEDFHEGNEVKLDEGELPIFHVDRPYRLPTYIKYIYEHRNEL